MRDAEWIQGVADVLFNSTNLGGVPLPTQYTLFVPTDKAIKGLMDALGEHRPSVAWILFPSSFWRSPAG